MLLWKIGTEFIQPIGRVTSQSAPKGVWKVVWSQEVSAISLSS
jgi:hypothetical protein